MRSRGEVGSQRAPGRNGKEVSEGPLYNRTLSLTEIKVTPPGSELTILFKKEEVPEGGLICSLYEDEGCIRPRKEFGARFKATLLEKVCLKDDLKLPEAEFYPTLKKLLDGPRNWGVEFAFRGLSSFTPYLMEWTQRILDNYKEPLEKAGIYGLVGISQFPYDYNKNVWKAFCEQWGPLTNTFHHGGGEVGISLNDLKVIGGLPILGDPYEEYLPPNDPLLDEAKYPPTVVELLQIHTNLCRHGSTSEVSWHKWIRHFYRGKLQFTAYGEDSSGSCKKKSHLPLEVEVDSKDPLPLRISDEGELAAYLALLLSRFILPFGSKSVRPEAFVMASFMARGQRISLAPTVLGHICNGLGKMATYPGSANPNFGIHFVVGWIAEYFPYLYPCRPDDEFDGSFPSLAKYAGVNGHDKSLYQARLIFRGTERVHYRAEDFGLGTGDRDYDDSDELSDKCFEQLLTIRYAFLPVRFGASMMLEPYYPNRYARQFGFDQGTPDGSLALPISNRSKRSLESIAIAYTQLFKRCTGALFHIPHSYHMGTYIYEYCGWWARVSAPYLTQSCNKINSVLTGRPCVERPVFVITDSRIVATGVRGAVRVPDERERPKRKGRESSNDSRYFKQQRRGNRSESSSSMGRYDLLPRANFSIPLGDALDEDNNSIFNMTADTTISLVEVTDDTATTRAEVPDAATPLAEVAVDEVPQAPSPGTHTESVGVVAIPPIPVSLLDVLTIVSDHWIRDTLITGIGKIAKMFSDLQSPKELSAERARLLRLLRTV